MKKIYFLLAACALMATGCDNTQNEPKQNEPIPFSTNTVMVADSIPFPPEAQEEGLTENMVIYSAVIDTPVTENETLRNNITGWIGSLLNEDYDGDSQDLKAMVEFEKKAFMEEMGGEMEMTPAAIEHTIKIAENNDRFVTYFDESWMYMGGVHGITYMEGATFSKATGNRFGYKMFKDLDQLNETVKAALQKQYFDPMLEEADATFEEVVYSEVSEAFSLPEAEPWIKNDSIIFLYEDGEIAPHVFGLPTCGFSFENLKDELTEEGKAFFNK